jgi:hypothetical protein
MTKWQAERGDEENMAVTGVCKEQVKRPRTKNAYPHGL